MCCNYADAETIVSLDTEDLGRVDRRRKAERNLEKIKIFNFPCEINETFTNMFVTLFWLKWHQTRYNLVQFA